MVQEVGILNNVILRDEVYDYLRKNILNYQFPPGHRFDLKELEKQLGISRTPLKVALHRLENEYGDNVLAAADTLLELSAAWATEAASRVSALSSAENGTRSRRSGW